jgi:drug/metabolite transporter (DMT)-like permease
MFRFIQHTQVKSASAILLATMFWGFTFVFIKEAMGMTDPFNFLFWRFFIASGLMLMVFPKIFFHLNITLFLHGGILGFALGMVVLTQTVGLQSTTASNGSFITGLSVILVALFSSLFSKKVPSFTICISIALAIVGLAFVTLQKGFSINPGDYWMMCTSIFFALYILLTGRFTAHHYSPALSFVQLFSIMLFALVASFFSGGICVPGQFLLWQDILFCSIFASVVAFTLQIHFQKYIDSTKTAIIFMTEPIFATIAAVLYGGEILSLQFLFGASLIFIAMMLSVGERGE